MRAIASVYAEGSWAYSIGASNPWCGCVVSSVEELWKSSNHIVRGEANPLWKSLITFFRVRIIKFGEGGEESQGGEVRGYLITKESQGGEVVLVLIKQGTGAC